MLNLFLLVMWILYFTSWSVSSCLVGFLCASNLWWNRFVLLLFTWGRDYSLPCGTTAPCGPITAQYSVTECCYHNFNRSVNNCETTQQHLVGLLEVFVIEQLLATRGAWYCTQLVHSVITVCSQFLMVLTCSMCCLLWLVHKLFHIRNSRLFAIVVVHKPSPHAPPILSIVQFLIHLQDHHHQFLITWNKNNNKFFEVSHHNSRPALFYFPQTYFLVLGW